MKYYKSEINLKSPFLLTCEHASDFIPLKYSNLGLTKEELENSKDLFDPGSLALAHKLVKDLKASLIYPEFSRLLIDANRNLEDNIKNSNTYHSACLKTDLILEREGKEYMISIPGNSFSDSLFKERKRWKQYVKPYLLAVENITEKLLERFPRVYIFQIHSFYPRYNGEVRKIDIGVVHNQNEIARRLISKIRDRTNLVIGDNQPWGMSAVGGGIFYNLSKNERIEDIGLDVNNKLLTNNEKINQIGEILKTSIEALY